MDDQQAQLRKGVVELAVLALLSGPERYGGEIVEQLAGAGLDVGAGTVYPLLSRLKTSGRVATSWHESPVGPPRKYYSLTPSGRAALAAQRTAWLGLSASMKQILTEEQS